MPHQFIWNCTYPTHWACNRYICLPDELSLYITCSWIYSRCIAQGYLDVCVKLHPGWAAMRLSWLLKIYIIIHHSSKLHTIHWQRCLWVRCMERELIWNDYVTHTAGMGQCYVAEVRSEKPIYWASPVILTVFSVTIYYLSFFAFDTLFRHIGSEPTKIRLDITNLFVLTAFVSVRIAFNTTKL